MASEKDLIGIWRLIRFEMTSSDGETSRPFGETPDGRLVYSAGGIMSAHLGRGDRPAFRQMGETNEARALGAMRTHFSYSGRYRVEDDQVFHDVDMSISPDWVGETKVRRISFDGADLVLTDEALEPRLGRDSGVGVLTWRREE